MAGKMRGKKTMRDTQTNMGRGDSEDKKLGGK
jgi:hypothetical protein